MSKKVKLSGILAVEKGEKNKSYAALTELHKAAQKADLFNGFNKTYQKLADDGEDFPAQSQVVQFSAPAVFQQVRQIQSEFFDLEATKDFANCHAKADVVVDGVVLVKDAPPTFLLFLEKQLSDLYTFVEKMPVLDSAESWSLDPNTGIFKTAPIATHKTKKLPRVIVKYEATKEHPAQTELLQEDVIVGHWNTIKQSGALPAPRKAEVLARIDKLSKAVKTAREEANGTACDRQEIAATLFNHIFS